MNNSAINSLNIHTKLFYCFLALALVAVQGCFSKKETTRPTNILGSWRWVKTWDTSGQLMTADSTSQRLVVTFRADSTYNIMCNDSVTLERARYFTAAAKVACRPDTVVQVIWYKDLDGHQIIDLGEKDTLVLIALDHHRSREALYSLFYRDTQ